MTETPNKAEAAEAAKAVIREQSWTFRRYFTYALTSANTIGVGVTLWKLQTASDLRTVALALIALNALLATYYLIGPTAEHIVAVARAFGRDRKAD